MDGRDNTIIEALLKIAQICGTFPSKTISFESFTYQLVIITLTLFNGVYSIYTNAVTYDPDKNAIMIFMEFLISSFTVVLGVSIQLISLRHYKICILFFQNLKVGCVKNSNSRKLSVFLELFAVHLAYFTRLSFIVWAWLPLIGTSALNYFFRHLNEYYSMIYVLLLVHINIVIKRKFLLLNKFLNHSNCIRYVRQNYGKTLQLINNFNIIFGYQILLIVTHAGIALLECLHDCLRFTDFKSIQNKYILFWDIFYSITITVNDFKLTVYIFKYIFCVF